LLKLVHSVACVGEWTLPFRAKLRPALATPPEEEDAAASIDVVVDDPAVVEQRVTSLDCFGQKFVDARAPSDASRVTNASVVFTTSAR
jgi:hypothetical protein